MAYLFIEAVAPAEFRVGLLDKTGHRITAVMKRSHAILGEVMKATRKTKLKGICVVSGPGSFTAVRTGVLIANVLARLHRLPLYGVDASQAADLDGLFRDLAAGAVPASGYVAPVYSSEPNITFKTP